MSSACQCNTAVMSFWCPAQNDLWWNINASSLFAVLRAWSLRQSHFDPDDCLLVYNHAQYWTGTFHFILSLIFFFFFFPLVVLTDSRNARDFHSCVNLVPIAMLAESGALQNVTQKCLNLSELCLNFYICLRLFCCCSQFLAYNPPVTLKRWPGKDVFPVNLHNSK